MRRLVAVLVMVLVWGQSAYADSPIMPHSWERAVGPYQFVMLWPHDTTAPGERRYPASGLYRADDQAEPLWTVDWYAHEGEVFLGADGEFVTRLGPWPGRGTYDELAVAFYRNGKMTKSHRVSDLVKSPEALPQSESHYQWHGDVIFDPDQLRLSVATIPGITYLFDVKTGAILSPGPVAEGQVGETTAPASASRTAPWAPSVIWTIGGAAVAAGIWMMMKRRRIT
ncbi:MAG TPA: hypothetical protein VD973_14985 [Symbiobacteriaceae bacterium]|jgi:hypothetical protein|nr:hypothetical protein [Symbiobacteriaceae bacterium]